MLKSEVFRVVSAAVLFLIKRHWCTRGDLSVDCYTAVTISGDLQVATYYELLTERLATVC